MSVLTLMSCFALDILCAGLGWWVAQSRGAARPQIQPAVARAASALRAKFDLLMSHVLHGLFFAARRLYARVRKKSTGAESL